ncbi:TPA: hypothetical protein N3288_000205 [Klebsiella aerogenes]|nr:hypothetical protein [Klebsiella aerogenes]
MRNNFKIELFVKALMQAYAIHKTDGDQQQHINELWNRLLMHGYKIDEAAAMNSESPACGISAVTYRIHAHRFTSSDSAVREVLEVMDKVFHAVRQNEPLEVVVGITDHVEDVFCALIDLHQTFDADALQEAFYDVWCAVKGITPEWEFTSTDTLEIIDGQIDELEVLIDELVNSKVVNLPDGSCPFCHVIERLNDLQMKLLVADGRDIEPVNEEEVDEFVTE